MHQASAEGLCIFSECTTNKVQRSTSTRRVWTTRHYVFVSSHSFVLVIVVALSNVQNYAKTSE